MIDIYIPTFRRPTKIAEVASNVKDTTATPYKLWFILEADDLPSIEACVQLGERYIINTRKACYAGAINTAYLKTNEPTFFMGADDIVFHEKWDKEALSHLVGEIMVVGTNDMHNPEVLEGTHSTHTLVARDYIETRSGVIDQSNTVLYEYTHNYCDTEFIETAKTRNVFISCYKAIVEHNHWAWGLAKMDATYEKGQRADGQDKMIYNSRQRLWQ